MRTSSHILAAAGNVLIAGMALAQPAAPAAQSGGSQTGGGQAGAVQPGQTGAVQSGQTAGTPPGMGANRGPAGDYWNNHWSWYDNTYTPYYQQSAPAYGARRGYNLNGGYSGGYIGGTGMAGQTAGTGQSGANLSGPGYQSGRGMFGPGSPQLQNGMVTPGATAGGNGGRVPQAFGQHSGAFGPRSPTAQNPANPVGGTMQYGWW